MLITNLLYEIQVETNIKPKHQNSQFNETRIEIESWIQDQCTSINEVKKMRYTRQNTNLHNIMPANMKI